MFLGNKAKIDLKKKKNMSAYVFYLSLFQAIKVMASFVD